MSSNGTKTLTSTLFRSSWRNGRWVVTARLAKPPARRSPGRNDPQWPFQPVAPFMAYLSFRNCPRQNHGTAGNREASSFVNSTVSYRLFPKCHWQERPPPPRPFLPVAPIHRQWTFFCSTGVVPVEVMEWPGTVNTAALWIALLHATRAYSHRAKSNTKAKYRFQMCL